MKVIVPLILACLVATATQAQLKFNTNANNTITITGYSGFAGDLVVPSITNGLLVTSIGSGAFDNNPSLTSIMLPVTLTNIGSDAFAACSGLKTISIPDNVSSIGFAAFWTCQSLTNINVGVNNTNFSSVNGVLLNKSQTLLIQYPGGKRGDYAIPNTVRSIGQEAFYGSVRVTNIMVPSSVTNIAPETFDNSVDLTNIVVDALNESFSSAGGVLFDKQQTKLIQYPGGQSGAYMVPASVKSIGLDAFAFSHVASVIISSGVTNIDSGAFVACVSLTNVVLPDHLGWIQTQTFWSCPHLTRVVIPASVTNIVADAFQYCALTNVYFLGDAPSIADLSENTNATIYYMPGTANWTSTFAGRPAVLWNPEAQESGMSANQFGFTITGTADIPIAIETSADLSGAAWSRLQTCTLTNGTLHFSDPTSTNFTARFYRVAGP